MNKYLSYEKSKRLAELNWHPDAPLEKYWKKDHTLNEMWLTGGPGIPAPDCHDLLMELQKHITKDLTCGDLVPRVFMQNKLFIICYKDQTIAADENPTEVLGAALIKLLEEKK